jgi:hypothetical protein
VLDEPAGVGLERLPADPLAGLPVVTDEPPLVVVDPDGDDHEAEPPPAVGVGLETEPTEPNGAKGALAAGDFDVGVVVGLIVVVGVMVVVGTGSALFPIALVVLVAIAVGKASGRA